MILSKRERYIAIATLCAVAVLLGDRYVLTPVLDRQTQLDAERQRLVADLARVQALFRRKKRLGSTWQQMIAAGLGSQPAEADSRVLRAVRDWSRSSGLTLSSLKPERATEAHGLRAIAFHASGTGPMLAVAGFLWQLQTAPFPLKVTELQIGARKAGSDDLTMQVRLSSLCLVTGPGDASGAGAQKP